MVCANRSCGHVLTSHHGDGPCGYCECRGFKYPSYKKKKAIELGKLEEKLATYLAQNAPKEKIEAVEARIEYLELLRDGEPYIEDKAL